MNNSQNSLWKHIHFRGEFRVSYHGISYIKKFDSFITCQKWRTICTGTKIGAN